MDDDNILYGQTEFINKYHGGRKTQTLMSVTRRIKPDGSGDLVQVLKIVESTIAGAIDQKADSVTVKVKFNEAGGMRQVKMIEVTRTQQEAL